MGCWKEKREQAIESLFGKIMMENFPNLVKETDIQVQEAQRIPNKMNPRRPTLGHMIVKMPKVKAKGEFKSSKRKAVSYLQRSSHKTTSWFLNSNFAGLERLA